MDYSSIKEDILQSVNWPKQILSPTFVEEYKRKRSKLNPSKKLIRQVVSSLIQVVNDARPLKSKCENPVRHNKLDIPSSFFKKFKMSSETGPLKKRRTFHYPAHLTEGPSDEEYVDRLLAEANSRADFWDTTFDWSSNLDNPCSKCSTTIHGNAFFLSFEVVYDPDTKENDLVFEDKYYCEMCATKENSQNMMKIQFSKYIWDILKEKINKTMIRDSLDYSWRFERVVCVDDCIPKALHNAFVKEMNALAKNSEHDFERTSFGKTKHLIDPYMYAYIPRTKSGHLYGRELLKEPEDESKFSWLPVDVEVDKDGNCKFLSYINNLYKEVYPNLYPILEAILSRFIPIFERSMSRAKRIRDKRIQVVIQAMDLIIEPGQSYEEDFHFLTTPSQNILGTGTYYYEDTKSIIDDGLAFDALPPFSPDWETEIPPGVRELLAYMVGTLLEKYNSIQEKLNVKLDLTKLSDSVIQAYFKNMNWRTLFFINTLHNFIDVGELEAVHRSCVVFSEQFRSSQIKLHVPSTAKPPQKRRILRFYLIDPNHHVPSSLHIFPQQEYYMLLYQRNLQMVKADGKPLPMDIIQRILSYLITHNTMPVESALVYREWFKVQYRTTWLVSQPVLY